MKILVIEDELEIQSLICQFFKDEGAEVDATAFYKDAERKISSQDYDCVIIDITLPDGNGLNLIKEMKRKHLSSCIIVVSARNLIEDKIIGLDLGADDYLAKPFSLAELNARIKSVMRRLHASESQDIIFNEIRVNPESRQIFVNEKELRLTPKEFDLLGYLMMNRNRVLTKENIVEHLWGDMICISANSFDFIYTHIRNIRHKIMAAGGRDYIKSVYSIGYKFVEE